MALNYEPHFPWHWVVQGLAFLTLLALLGRFFTDLGRVFGRRLRTRIAVVILSLLAALLFSLAALNPVYTGTPDPNALHLAVVVDISESMQRTQNGWPQVQRQTGALIQEGVAAVAPSIQAAGTASILTFGRSASVAERSISLAQLADAFSRLSEQAFALGDASNLALGLSRGGEEVQQAGGRGAILLVSDGNQTEGDSLAAARRIARQGVPIHVLPITSVAPEMAVTDADLPPLVNAGMDTYLRGVLLNRSDSAVDAQLSVARNPGWPDIGGRFGAALVVTRTLSFTPDLGAQLRVPMHFEGAGLQFIDLALRSVTGQGEHRRRFFTHVYEPPAILAVGDNRWVAALSPDAAAVTQIAPDQLTEQVALREFDAVVISSVPAGQLPTGALPRLVAAIETDGLGLMLMNGDHQGADPETQTVLMSYNGTPLEPLLPVATGPRPVLDEPPTRQVVIAMDASGSMAGWPLAKSKEIAVYIIEHLLRPQDRLDVLVFTTGAQQLVVDQVMSLANKRSAISSIDAIVAGGGTDPTAVLQAIAGRNLRACGLIFISDGEFQNVQVRPDCRATVFAVNQGSAPAGSPLYELADPFPVDMAFDPAAITIPYFEPEPRDKFFEPGEYTPRAVDYLAMFGDSLSIPDLPLQGAAVSYIKDNAELIAVRPKLIDPVLAYRASKAGYVGVFTTELPSSWIESEAGRGAVEAWIKRLLAYEARDRYTFRLVDSGDELAFEIALVAQASRAPAVDRLLATIEFTDSMPIDLLLRSDPSIAATFHGSARLPRASQTQAVTLVLREQGPDARSRPQRIPLLIPPAGAVTAAPSQEAYSFGLNEPLLREIAQISGGRFNPELGAPFFHGRTPEQRGDPLWPWLLVAATCAYLGAIAVRRFDV